MGCGEQRQYPGGASYPGHGRHLHTRLTATGKAQDAEGPMWHAGDPDHGGSIRDLCLLERRFDLCGHGGNVRTDGVAHVAREVHTDHTRCFNHHEIEMLGAFDPSTEGAGGYQPQGIEARRWFEGQSHPMTR